MYDDPLFIVLPPTYVVTQVVELDLSYRERVHNYQLHSYMYGQNLEPPPGVPSATVGGEALTDLILSPSSTVIGLNELTIYRIGEGQTFYLFDLVHGTQPLAIQQNRWRLHQLFQLAQLA